jgi:hypothetical protein
MVPQIASRKKSKKVEDKKPHDRMKPEQLWNQLKITNLLTFPNRKKIQANSSEVI